MIIHIYSTLMIEMHRRISRTPPLRLEGEGALTNYNHEMHERARTTKRHEKARTTDNTDGTDR